MKRGILVLITLVVLALCGTARADVECAEMFVAGDSCRFGLWGEALESPYMTVAVGGNVRFLPRSRPKSALAAARSTMTTEPLPATTTSDVGYGYVERVTVGLTRQFYLGIEMELGLSNVDAEDPGSRRVVAAGVGLAGLRLGTSFVTLSGELGAGGRVIEIASDPRFDGGGIVEARARLDLWLAPWLTIGASLGTNLLDRQEWSAGLSLAMHTWAYGRGH